MTTPGIIERLLAIEVSALSDADKTLPVADPALRLLAGGGRFAGPAMTLRAPADHLPLFDALARAETGDVLVVEGDPAVAVLGELFATEARRRGLAGIVVDGYVRDLAGLRAAGLPVFARGTTPRSGSARSRSPVGGTVRCGGIEVARGDLVFGDDDGVLIADAARVAAALPTAEAIGRAERSILERMRAGTPLHELTTWAEHVAALDRGEDSALGFS